MATLFRSFLITTLLTLGAHAHAEDREWVPLKRLMEITYLDRFYDVAPAQRDRVRIRGSMSPANKSINVADIVFTIASTQGKERVAVRADGSFDLAPSPKLLAENPMVWTSMPAGEKGSFGFSVYAVLPEAQKFAYADLMAGVKQTNAIIKAKAGLLSMLAPKMNGVVVRFAKPAQQTLQIASKDGVKTLTADAAGVIKLKLEDSLFTENPQVGLSERPLEVEIDGI